MNASAKSNKEQADVESDETSQIAVGSAGESQSKYETNEAEASKSRYDKKWQGSTFDLCKTNKKNTCKRKYPFN
jgi:hypothetical protein